MDDGGFAAMFRSRAFWIATALVWSGGNSGLIQTFLTAYLVQTLI
jgi:MHS family metabolite:H+ symporter-like MFS transporter